MSEKKPNAIDKHVGNQLRLRRNLLNLSQEKLGEKIGVTFQQVQKYEKGLNRIGASRLKTIADALGTDVSYFFDGRPDAISCGINEPNNDEIHCSTAESAALIRAFQKIKDKDVRARVLSLINSLSKTQNLEEASNNEEEYN